MYKYFDKLGFKAGDVVKCVESDYEYIVGKHYTLTKDGTTLCTFVGGERVCGYYGSWELVEPVAPEFKAIDIYNAYLSSRSMTERLLLAYSDKTYEGSDYSLSLVKEELVELIKRLETINIKLDLETV